MCRKLPRSRNHVMSGNITTWNGMTMAATNIMKRKLDHFVLLRTSTQAVMAEQMEMIASDSTVMITLSRMACTKLKVGLFHTEATFSKKTPGDCGRPTAELMISALVRMELSTTIANGMRKKMETMMPMISSATFRPGWMAFLPLTASVCITSPPPCSYYSSPG